MVDKYLGAHTGAILDEAVNQQYYGTPSQVVGNDDFAFSVNNLKINPNTSKPDYDEVEGEFLFDDSSTETVIGSRITSHKFQIALTEKQIEDGVTQLLWKPHFHWFQESAGNPYCRLEYKLNPAGEPEGTWQTLNGSVQEFPYVSGSLEQINVFDPIDVTNLLNTAVLVKIRFSRIGGDVLDTYTGDVRFLGFDFHVPEDQERGSIFEFIKE